MTSGDTFGMWMRPRVRVRMTSVKTQPSLKEFVGIFGEIVAINAYIPPGLSLKSAIPLGDKVASLLELGVGSTCRASTLC